MVEQLRAATADADIATFRGKPSYSSPIAAACHKLAGKMAKKQTGGALALSELGLHHFVPPLAWLFWGTE